MLRRTPPTLSWAGSLRSGLFQTGLKRIAFPRIDPAVRIGGGGKASLAGAGGLIFRHGPGLDGLFPS